VRVVVTGHCGFIGHHVFAKLVVAGHEVMGLDRKDRERPVELADYLGHLFDGREAVIHCAAHADVRGNWEPGRLGKVREDNELATHSVLDASARAGIKSFVFVSTGAVYADQMSPYAASKLAGEAWCKAYADKFGWRLSIVRPAACYGDGYHHGHIADFVRMAREAGRVKALTAGERRDGCHVEDCADFIVEAATGQRTPGTYYVRSEGAWGCKDTVRVMGAEAEWSAEKYGWLGDTSMFDRKPGLFAIGMRSLEDGVRDSLRSLGWPVP
jgi:nucleoside-diphosphate-sugar epimerase